MRAVGETKGWFLTVTSTLFARLVVFVVLILQFSVAPPVDSPHALSQRDKKAQCAPGHTEQALPQQEQPLASARAQAQHAEDRSCHSPVLFVLLVFLFTFFCLSSFCFPFPLSLCLLLVLSHKSAIGC